MLERRRPSSCLRTRIQAFGLLGSVLSPSVQRVLAVLVVAVVWPRVLPAAEPLADTEEMALDAAVADCEAGRVAECLTELDGLSAKAESPRVRAQARTIAARMRRTPAPAATPQARGMAAELPAEPTETQRTEGGRALTLTTTTLLGLGLYGVTLPTVLHTQDDRALVGWYMLAAGASFGIPYALTRDGSTWGQANLGYYGGTRGALHGVYLAALLTDNKADTDLILGMASLFSIAEMSAAHIWAGRANLGPGEANAMGVGHDLGMFLGMTLWMVASGDSIKDAQRGLPAMLLLGGAGGAFGGLNLARVDQLSWGDAEAIHATSLLGILAGGTVLGYIKSDDPGPVGVLLGIGALGGAWAGERLVHDRELSAGRGLMLDLGTLAGGLAGAGTAYLAGADDYRPYLTGSLLGAVAGFALVFAGADDMPVLRKAASWLEERSDLLANLQVSPTLVAPNTMGVALGSSF